jgi:uncharacterized protein YqeY
MSDPRTQLQDALKTAMMNKDNLRRDVIRVALSEVKQVEVDQRKTLAADEVVTILQREVKKRRESIDEAQRAGRTDIVEAVQAEVVILQDFLPAQLSREEIVALTREAIVESGATSAKEMGKVMAVLMPKVKGVADGKLVNEVVRELLKP